MTGVSWVPLMIEGSVFFIFFDVLRAGGLARGGIRLAVTLPRVHNQPVILSEIDS
jgi:hypothetical protein